MADREKIVPYLNLVDDARSEPSVQNSVPSSSGGSNGGGMEPRIAKLEANVDHIQRDIAELKADVRGFRDDMREVRERIVRLEEKVAHLPSKGFVVSSLIVSLALITALAVFQNRIQEFAGVVPTANSQSLP